MNQINVISQQATEREGGRGMGEGIVVVYHVCIKRVDAAQICCTRYTYY